MENIVEIAKKVFITCMGVKAGEKILILTDNEKIELASYFEQASRSLGMDTTLVEINNQKGGEPPENACKALKGADVCLMITTNSYTHTKARVEANNRGCRIASLPGISKEIVKKTFGADYEEIERISTNLSDMMSAAKRIRLITQLGTDISFNIEGRKGIADTGKLDEFGAFGNLPAGEAMIAPVENVSTGTVVIDGVICTVGIPKQPIILTIKDGKIVNIKNDEGKLHSFMSNFAENIDKVAEFGIGTNKLAEIINNPLVDEKVFSTVHLGFGNNLFMGGNQNCNIHFDMIIKEPTVYLDDICI
ncbi:MAG: aminopeptidase, partial [Clostridia bacterium]|nr:aminopeptidase [Clostridia bacterium]